MPRFASASTPTSPSRGPRARARVVIVALVFAACVTTEVQVVSQGPESERLLAEGDAFFRARGYEDALDTYKLAAFAAGTEGNESRGAAASAQVAHVFAILGDFDAGRPWLARAIENATDERADAWTRTLLTRGVYEREQAGSAVALATFTELYDYCLGRELHDRAIQAAHMATLVTDGEARVRWARRGIAEADAAGNDRWRLTLWTSLGWLLEDEARFDESLEAFRVVRRIAERLADEHELLRADWMVGHAQRMAGLALEARTTIVRTLARAERRYTEHGTANDAEWIAHCLRELGELEASEGRRAAALVLFGRARERFIDARIAVLAPRSLALLDARIAELAGDVPVTGGAADRESR